MPRTGESVITTGRLFVGTRYIKFTISVGKVVISVEISPRPTFIEEYILTIEGYRVRKSLGSKDNI